MSLKLHAGTKFWVWVGRSSATDHFECAGGGGAGAEKNQYVKVRLKDFGSFGARGVMGCYAVRRGWAGVAEAPRRDKNSWCVWVGRARPTTLNVQVVGAGRF